MKKTLYFSIFSFLVACSALYAVANLYDKLNEVKTALLAQGESFGAALNISTIGTSTMPNGLNLTTGCFTQAGGNCVGAVATTYHSTTYSTSTAIKLIADGTATSSFITIPAGLLSASSTITIDGGGSASTAAALNTCSIIISAGTNGVTLGSKDVYSDNAIAQTYMFHAVIVFNNSLSIQSGLIESASAGGTAAATIGGSSAISGTVNFSNATLLSVSLNSIGAGTPSCILNGYTVIINP